VLQTAEAFRQALAVATKPVQNVQQILAEAENDPVAMLAAAAHGEASGTQAGVPRERKQPKKPAALCTVEERRRPTPPTGMVVVDSDGVLQTSLQEAQTSKDFAQRGMHILKEGFVDEHAGLEVCSQLHKRHGISHHLEFHGRQLEC
jgi:hypothetical protein